MTRGIGIDFGTTNSALAVADEGRRVSLARFASAAGATTAFRSVLFFGREHSHARVESAAGPRAIERYLELEGQRRLMQSLKSFLASGLFSATHVFGQTHSLEDLISQIVSPLRAEAEAAAPATSACCRSDRACAIAPAALAM